MTKEASQELHKFIEGLMSGTANTLAFASDVFFRPRHAYR